MSSLAWSTRSQSSGDVELRLLAFFARLTEEVVGNKENMDCAAHNLQILVHTAARSLLRRGENPYTNKPVIREISRLAESDV